MRLQLRWLGILENRDENNTKFKKILNFKYISHCKTLKPAYMFWAYTSSYEGFGGPINKS